MRRQASVRARVVDAVADVPVLRGNHDDPLTSALISTISGSADCAINDATMNFVDVVDSTESTRDGSPRRRGGGVTASSNP